MTTSDDRLDENNLYGFRWGPLNVIRTASLSDGRRVLSIKSDGTSDRFEVYASATGRSVRVFKNEPF